MRVKESIDELLSFEDGAGGGEARGGDSRSVGLCGVRGEGLVAFFFFFLK